MEERGGGVVEGGGDVVKEGGGALWREGEGMLWKEGVEEGVEGGDMTVGECKVAEVMELVELPQVLVDFFFIVKFY